MSEDFEIDERFGAYRQAMANIDRERGRPVAHMSLQDVQLNLSNICALARQHVQTADPADMATIETFLDCTALEFDDLDGCANIVALAMQGAELIGKLIIREEAS